MSHFYQNHSRIYVWIVWLFCLSLFLHTTVISMITEDRRKSFLFLTIIFTHSQTLRRLRYAWLTFENRWFWIHIGHCVKSVKIQSFFWSVFSRIRTKYGEILLRISPYSVRMWDNTGPEKTPYLDILHTVIYIEFTWSVIGTYLLYTMHKIFYIFDDLVQWRALVGIFNCQISETSTNNRHNLIRNFVSGLENFLLHFTSKRYILLL